jgi:hypothetical protein
MILAGENLQNSSLGAASYAVQVDGNDIRVAV